MEPVCSALVCDERPECCQDNYDQDCIDVALKVCELPTPENHCLKPSHVPGCTDDKCLKVVCDEEEDCCTTAYSAECVDIARENGLVCHPPEDDNDCFQDSPYGGCNDVRCANLVCDIREGCCDDDTIGEWSDICVRIAENICEPEVLSR
jgi:hypothetical protein